MKPVSPQRQVETIFKKEKKSCRTGNIIPKMKYSLSRPNIRWEMAEERANELDDRSIEIILLEEQREKRF